MGNKKQTFAQLTEDLDNLQKSEPVNIDEPVVPVVEPEVVEPVAEEPKAEEPKAEEPVAEEPKAEEPKEEEPVAKSAEEPKVEDPEELEKAKKEDKPEDKDEDKEPKKDDKKKKEDKKEDKEPVKKSESSEDEVTEADFVGAFEAVVKSYGGIKAELDELKKSMADIMALLQKPEVVEEPVAKSAEPATEEPVTEPEEEPVSKSVEEPEEDSEGKAVEYISKSDGVPELPVEEEPQPEDEPEVEFKAIDHVKAVTEYYMKSTTALTQGQKAALRGAVNRVKRNEGLESDIALFKEIVESSEN
jgi:hypothetical protein